MTGTKSMPLVVGQAAAADGSTCGARLDRLPIGRFHRRILALIASGMFFDGFDVYLTGSVVSAIVAERFASKIEAASFVSSTFVGMAIGAWCAGIIGDRFGRRFSYQFNLAVFGLASLAAAVAPSIEWLIAFRLMSGIGLGAEVVVGYATLTEFVPPHGRGRWGATLSVVTNLSVPASALAAYLIIPAASWRWMFVIPGAGALVVWQLRKSMPESPRWLEARGRLNEAEQCLRAIELEAGVDGPAPRLTEVQASKPAPISALLLRPMRRATLVGLVVVIAINTAIFGFVTWVPSFLVGTGMTTSASLGHTLLMSLGAPVGALGGAILSDKLGRRFGIAATALIAGALGLFYPFAGSADAATWIGFSMFVCIYFIVALGITVYLPELFPTALRLRGVGLCSTAGRLVSIGLPYAVVLVFGQFGVVGVLAVFVAGLVVMAAVVGGVGPDTRQKSLEAIAPDAREGAAS